MSQSAKLYYLVIAVADVFQLLIGTFVASFLEDGLLLLTENRFSLRISRYSHATCKLFYLLNELSESLSNYTLVALALERCLIIFFPLRAKRFVCLRFSAMLIAIIVAPAWICAFISVPIIVELDTEMQHFSQSGCECEKNQEHSLTAAFTVALTVFCYMIHTIMNIILVTIISIKLAHIRYKRKAMIRNNLMHVTHRIPISVSQKHSNFDGYNVATRRTLSVDTQKQNHQKNRHSLPAIKTTNQTEQVLREESSKTSVAPFSSTQLSDSKAGSRFPSCKSDGWVGIGATVVMVLLAAINVVIYMPAAVVELTLWLLDEDKLEQNTRTYSTLMSLSRFLFDNLCLAHSLNFFVYVGRYERLFLN